MSYIWKFVKGLFAYFREFGYIRVGNEFHPSTKKFWAQVAQFIFVAAVSLKIFGNAEVSSRISDTLIGMLLGHAGAAMTWYGIGKNKDVSNAMAAQTVIRGEQADEGTYTVSQQTPGPVSE
jgi:cytochrome c biogenesis factor